MTTIMFNLLKETFLSLVGRLTFTILLERFSTRLVVYGLEKLKAQSTNDVVEETVNDVINQLSGKKLKVVEDLRKRL
jgi:hypothetical protein